MLDPNEAALKFQKADDALNEIINARPKTEEGARNRAIAAQEDLALQFTADAIERVNDRTAMFQGFINAMVRVINDIGRDSPLKGITMLKSVVDESRALLIEVNKNG